VRSLVVAVLLLLPGAVQAQQDTVIVEVQSWSPLAGAIATTGCMGGRIYQAIDMEYLTHEIFEEVVEHEATHRRQYEKYLATHDGICPALPPLHLLSWEIQAYCEGRELRFERELAQVGDADYTGDIELDVDGYYLRLLTSQFKGQLPKPMIELKYRQDCLEET
jgi:hypothetical protein